jgi:hypothetical protein
MVSNILGNQIVILDDLEFFKSYGQEMATSFVFG